MYKIFIAIFTSNILLPLINSLQCGEEVIEHCIQCGIEENSDSCVQCEENHFLFFNNLLCLPCDHPIYGNIGCGGNCDGSKYKEIGNILCDENNCKEGYYNIEGFCFQCSNGSDYCDKCTYLPSIENNNEKEYKCQKCINNEYQISDDGRCHHCFIKNCIKCHYPLSSNNPICDKCSYNYYINSNGDCSYCHLNVKIPNGYCKVCSDNLSNYESGECYCDYSYTLKGISSCIPCPKNCGYCKYLQYNDNTECYRCKKGYTLNSKKECVNCGENCEYCNLDKQENPICTSCFNGFSLNEDKNCLICPDHCKACKKNKNGEIECIKCFEMYGLNEDNKCVNCPDLCAECLYKKEINDFICTSCLYSKKCLYNKICLYNNIYLYYKNIIGKNQKCYSCSSIQEIGGEGCIRCLYNSKEDKYECLECIRNYNNENQYIYIINEKSCKLPNLIGLNNDCIEGENIGTEINPQYSCINCRYNNNVKVINNNNIMNCHKQMGNLVNCLEAKEDSNGNIKCIKCASNFPLIYSNKYNQNICDSKCESDSFLKNNWCYKCDDKYYGNIGCVASKGCNYISSNDQLVCNECKEGFFEYTKGQCFSCSKENIPCKKCHVNSNSIFECDICMDGYVLNEKTKKCELITCEEYPEITPGCIICKDKYEEYKSKNKCQSCKNGFFKTKNESCIYCKARKNGGPKCEQCEYEIDENGNEIDKIKCKYCPNNNILSNDGKCYNCKDELGQNCDSCKFNIEEDNKEKLICTSCSNNYVLNSKGCVSYNSYYQTIPKCSSFSYEIFDYSIYNEIVNELNERINTYNINLDLFKIDKNKGYIIKNNSICLNYTIIQRICIFMVGYKCPEGEVICSKWINLDDFFENYEKNKNEKVLMDNILIKTKCLKCKKGYYKDYYGNCIGLTTDTCSYISIINSNKEKYDYCSDFCKNNNLVSINYTFNKTFNNNETNYNNNQNKTNDLISINLDYILKKYGFNSLNLLDNDLKSIIVKGKLCISNSEKEGKNNLKKCKLSEYKEDTDSYICLECIDGYSLDKETNKCKQNINLNINIHPGLSNCYIENIGTIENPIYSCKKCYDNKNILVSIENGAKFCSEQINELQGCTEVNADTSYIDNIYNCSLCSFNYISYYSRFYERKICQNIYKDIIKNKLLSNSNFEKEESILAINGKCENKKLFTPDGINCYACNNKNVGMVGCKGSCTFSTYRNNIIECEEGQCKTGFLERTKGICEPCNIINGGCIECHYDNNYLNNYLGLKRKRRFICDQCEEGYIKAEDGYCYHCSELGFKNCLKCKYDNDNELMCDKCNEGYFLTDDGFCGKCNSPQIKSIRNTCIYCDDIDEGGIEGCQKCYNNGEQILCLQCGDGFILFENNQTCLKISENYELTNYINCLQLSLDNEGNLFCSKCIDNYILLKENNEIRCVNYNFIPSHNILLNKYCKESINLGSEDQPDYSCKKCISNEYITTLDKQKGKTITKITFINNNTAFCDYSSNYKQLENCTEASINIINNIKVYNCTKCELNNSLNYNEDTNTNICIYNHYEKKCMVKYCKTCQKSNNYFCSICLPEDYEVNSITGSCVKKVEKVPDITWKDILRLQMNQQRIINGKEVYGPSLVLKGITNSQINTGHAFLIYLVFKLKNPDNNIRNLEEEIKIPTICEIIDSVDETDDDLNIVEYDCIGNMTLNENNDLNLNDYNLNNIEQNVNDNNGVIGKNNLDEIVSNTELSNLENKEKSNFTLGNLIETTTFKMDEIKNQTSDNYIFDFTINGEINKELKESKISGKIELAEIKNKSADCKLIIQKNKKAALNCVVNIEKYKNYKILSFKISEIVLDETKIYLLNMNKIKI